MSKKIKTKIPQEAIDTVENTVSNAGKNESYLFIGNAYIEAFIKARENLSLKKAISIFSVYYKSEYEDFVNFCAECKNRYLEGRVFVLYLKKKDRDYQEGLKVIIEKLQIPLLVFVGSDGLSDSLVARFKSIFKIPNERVKVAEFITPNKALTMKSLKSFYVCPTVIKLADYRKMSPSGKIIDTVISLLSVDGSVYPEVLSELRPPAKEVEYDTKLEALSLLKNRRQFVGGNEHD